MTKPRTSLIALLLLAATLALMLPASGLATGRTTVPAPAAEAQTEAVPPGPEATSTQTGTASPPTPAPAPTPTHTSTTASPPPAPQVQQQFSQGVTPGAPAPAAKAKSGAGGEAPGAGESAAALRARLKALSPSTLTPSLPLGLQSSLAGVPGFFIESFRIPPFLLPIFQAAGTAYGIPWQVLAAINEVETDYGRDLNVSSAGAEGWMQFLPSSWAQYGVDANGDGFKDPYNPADAIFAAARYLRAAGGQTDIRTAVFAYNHSQAYVDSVMLRAQLLGGTPSELLGAITGVTEARFPVHAAAHFSDGFPTVPGAAGAGGGPARTLVGTSIYSSAGAAVIAVQDGEVVRLGNSAELGRFISLRDAFGNTYTYAHLGDVATVYPVLRPHANSTVSSNVSPQGPREPAPTGPATAGAQPRSPVSEGATVSGLALGAAAGLEATPTTTAPAPKPPAPAPAAASVTTFRAGVNDVFLHPLHQGAQVISGTVLGHVGAASGEAAPHIDFQIRPAGLGAPLIDPKPILDGWVALENTSIFRARGQNPFLATSPTVGQVLLESKQQLQPQVLHDGGIALGRCGREAVQGGRVDKRLLALLEYLSVSGLKPTVGGLACGHPTSPASTANAAASSSAQTIAITAINGTPVAGHQTPGSVVDAAVRKLLMLQGAARPKRVVSLMSYPGATGAVANPTARAAINVTFATDHGLARTAGLRASTLSPSEWIRLVARLGEIPDPTVARAPSAAAIADNPGAAGAAGEGTSGGNH